MFGSLTSLNKHFSDKKGKISEGIERKLCTYMHKLHHFLWLLENEGISKGARKRMCNSVRYQRQWHISLFEVIHNFQNNEWKTEKWEFLTWDKVADIFLDLFSSSAFPFSTFKFRHESDEDGCCCFFVTGLSASTAARFIVRFDAIP